MMDLEHRITNYFLSAPSGFVEIENPSRKNTSPLV